MSNLPDWLTGAGGYDEESASASDEEPTGTGETLQCWQCDGVIASANQRYVTLTVTSLGPTPAEKVVHDSCFVCFKCSSSLGGGGSSSDGSFIEAGAQLYCVPCGRVARMASELEEDARTEAEMKRLLAASAAQGKMNLDDVAALASDKTAAAKEAELTARMGKTKKKKKQQQQQQ
uniref:LIM zinc-binding domain-containing protein n=1 Tax=Sexangularia sp. CB-2014 TaxID=1486929 RepID=A0A7S1VCU3_9EUKA|mmetsp:Transcript_16419/g.51360  ORF Transcript_16419/g.51360 Transcript_16419/m.51360 type:complete len:176 (+) Transcript_16419:60-587(+)